LGDAQRLHVLSRDVVGRVCCSSMHPD
jgi:hypothetical protein